jgi:putative ABC transport system permease protein
MAAAGWLSVLGRLKPDATPAQAEAMLRLEAARMDRENPGRITTITIARATLLSGDGVWMKILAVAGLSGGLMALWLLMTCANAANLVLARSVGRRREFALRVALGATRPRLVRELMVENVLIAILAGAFGLAGAAVLAPLVVAAGPFPLLAIDLSPDWRVYLFTLLLSFVSAVAFGALPTMQSSRVDLQTVMKDDAATLGAHGRGWSRHRNTLIAAQVALAFVLLASAAFVVRGSQVAERIDLGFERRGLVTSPVDFAAVRGVESVVLFQRRVVDAVRARGDGIAFATVRPLSGAATVHVRHPGQDDPGTGALPVSQNHVSGSYFATLGIPIVRGRAFTDATADANTVVVSQVIASRMWPGENPVDKAIVVDERTYLVAGVAAEVRMTLSTGVAPMIYRPLTPDTRAGATIIVRTADVAGAVAALKQTAAAIDPRVLVAPVSLEADLARRVRDEGRVQLALSTVVALLALVLTGSGIYSVISYLVGQSIREIAVRVALGARRSHVMALVMTRGMRPIVSGLVVGLLGAIGAAQLLRGLMFGLSPLDPIALATALLFLGVVSGVAILVPTLRAVRMRPSDVLRA